MRTKPVTILAAQTAKNYGMIPLREARLNRRLSQIRDYVSRRFDDLEKESPEGFPDPLDSPKKLGDLSELGWMPKVVSRFRLMDDLQARLYFGMQLEEVRSPYWNPEGWTPRVLPVDAENEVHFAQVVALGRLSGSSIFVGDGSSLFHIAKQSKPAPINPEGLFNKTLRSLYPSALDSSRWPLRYRDAPVLGMATNDKLISYDLCYMNLNESLRLGVNFEEILKIDTDGNGVNDDLLMSLSPPTMRHIVRAMYGGVADRGISVQPLHVLGLVPHFLYPAMVANGYHPLSHLERVTEVDGDEYGSLVSVKHDEGHWAEYLNYTTLEARQALFVLSDEIRKAREFPFSQLTREALDGFDITQEMRQYLAQPDTRYGDAQEILSNFAEYYKRNFRLAWIPVLRHPRVHARVSQKTTEQLLALANEFETSTPSGEK
jgi:hypothetical protein